MPSESPLPQLHAYSDSQDSQATGPRHHCVDNLNVIDQYLAAAIPEQTSTHQLPSASRTMPKGHLLYTALQPAPSIVSHLYTSLLPGEAFPGLKLNEAIQKELNADHIITTTILFIDILFPDEHLPFALDDAFLQRWDSHL
jgi:hypothetical protein